MTKMKINQKNNCSNVEGNSLYVVAFILNLVSVIITIASANEVRGGSSKWDTLLYLLNEILDIFLPAVGMAQSWY